MLKKDTFAPRPPMGWNSWDCYGAAVNEEQLLGNAQYVADNLKQYGWEYITCDIQWYEPKATSNFYNEFTAKIREALDEGRFEEFYNKYREILDTRVQD